MIDFYDCIKFIFKQKICQLLLFNKKNIFNLKLTQFCSEIEYPNDFPTQFLKKLILKFTFTNPA